MTQNIEIENALKAFNPWWKEKYNINFKHRDIYEKINQFMKYRQIISLTGLRRVGKTMIMKKIIIDKIKQGFNPEDILYFSFDEFKNIRIMDVINAYEKLMKKDIQNVKLLLLFDEIQKINDWENQIKVIYDLHEKYKMIISGSETLFIKNKSRESLSGRIYEFKVSTLDFKEYLDFINIKYDNLDLYEKELKSHFNDYIRIQGFPELVGIVEFEAINKYLIEGIVQKCIYNDIPKLFGIKNPFDIERLFNIIMNEPGQVIELVSLSSDLGFSRQTLSLYLHYLETVYLVKKAYNFSKNARKTERKLKKFYPLIYNPVHAFIEDSLVKSKIFENFVFIHSKSDFFWRDSFQNEVDMIINSENNKFFPVEIKYGKIEFNGLIAFMKKFKINEGIILSYDQEFTKTINKKISVIPAWKWFLR